LSSRKHGELGIEIHREKKLLKIQGSEGLCVSQESGKKTKEKDWAKFEEETRVGKRASSARFGPVRMWPVKKEMGRASPSNRNGSI